MIAGLSKPKKALSPKYLYDAQGSQLFEEICATPEYYVTRVEQALFTRSSAISSTALPNNAALIEFGSGASEKTRTLLDRPNQFSTYVPIDMSAAAVNDAVQRLTCVRIPISPCFPSLEISRPSWRCRNRCAISRASDFSRARRSAISNTAEAVQLLRTMREMLGPNSHMILGADLIKDPATLRAAYNDAAGVTTRFIKNLLARINRELDGNFDLAAFSHNSIWNEERHRMEMYLVSKIDQIVNAAGESFAFKTGERLHTENSHKFSAAGLTQMARDAGWTPDGYWESTVQPFAIMRLKPRADSTVARWYVARVIEFSGVTKSYAASSEPSVRNLSLTIGDGVFQILAGPSGCGKTTTLNMLNRLIERDAGTIRIDGQDIRDEDPVALAPAHRLRVSGSRTVSAHDGGGKHRDHAAIARMECDAAGSAHR